jgi:hypothetical protein
LADTLGEELGVGPDGIVMSLPAFNGQIWG